MCKLYNKYMILKNPITDKSFVKFSNQTLKSLEKSHLLFALTESPSPGAAAGCFERGGGDVQRLLGGY